MRKVCDITFEFDDLTGAEYDAQTPRVSQTLDAVLRGAPSFVRSPHHGIYNYECSLGACNTIRIENTGLFVIMHDGECFDRHPLLVYLEAKLPTLFPSVRFHSYSS
jgi:hypothetical protein